MDDSIVTPTQLVKEVNAKLRLESAQRQRQMAHAKRVVAIWRSANGGTFQVVSDPAWQQWQAHGAPSCGTTWTGEYGALPADQRDDHVGE